MKGRKMNTLQTAGEALDSADAAAGASPTHVPEVRFGNIAQPSQEHGRTNSGDETGGAVERFGWDISGAKPKVIPATNGAYVWYSDYLKLWKSVQPRQAGELSDAEIDEMAMEVGIRIEPRFGLVSTGNIQLRQLVRAAINAKGDAS